MNQVHGRVENGQKACGDAEFEPVAARCVVRSANAPRAANSRRRRLLPRNRPRSSTRADLLRRPRSRSVRCDAGAGGAAQQMALPRLLLDAEPLSPDPRDAVADALEGDARTQPRVRKSIQQTARSNGTSVRGPLLVFADRDRRASRRRLPLHPAQPCPGRPVSARHRVALVGRRTASARERDVTASAASVYLVQEARILKPWAPRAFPSGIADRDLFRSDPPRPARASPPA